MRVRLTVVDSDAGVGSMLHIAPLELCWQPEVDIGFYRGWRKAAVIASTMMPEGLKCKRLGRVIWDYIGIMEKKMETTI